MRNYAFTADERPTMANFNARFDAIAALANGLGNEYVWEKNKETSHTEIVKVKQYGLGGNTTHTCQASSSVKFVNGVPQLVSPYSTTVHADATVGAQLEGLYVDVTPIWGADAGVCLCTGYNGSNLSFYTIKEETVVDKEFFGYVNSADPNAYPHSVSDGYTYTALGQLGAKTQIATGSYVGTNASTVTLHFDFTPKFLIVIGISNQSGGYSSQFASFVYSATTGISLSSSSFNSSGDIPDVSWGNTISWTSTSTQKQLNHGYYTYYYIAIG